MEMCLCEQIREDIINERQEAMAKFGFYEDLEKNKQEVRFTSKDQSIEHNTKHGQVK